MSLQLLTNQGQTLDSSRQTLVAARLHTCRMLIDLPLLLIDACPWQVLSCLLVGAIIFLFHPPHLHGRAHNDIAPIGACRPQSHSRLGTHHIPMRREIFQEILIGPIVRRMKHEEIAALDGLMR